MAETKSARPEGGGRPRRGLILGGVAAGVVVLAGVAYGVGYALSGNTLAPKTTIAGVDVGGLAPAEAEAKLTAELAQRSSDPITLTAADQSTTRTPQELGLAVDYAASVRAAGGGKSFDPRVIWENLTGGGEQSAVVGVDRAAADESEHRRNRLHAQLAGELRVGVDVDLDQLDLALGGQDVLLDRRAELAARAAPGRPEVDDDRGVLRRLDDVGHEAGVGAVLDQVAGGGLGLGLADQAHEGLPNGGCRDVTRPGAKMVP